MLTWKTLALSGLACAACGRPTEGNGSAAVSPPEAAGVALEEPSLPASLDERTSERVVAVQEEQPVDSSHHASNTVQILGRAVDESGIGIPRAKVHLGSVGEPWAQGGSADDFETTTDHQGRFELTTPLPQSSWVHLMLVPDEFHALGGREFGPAGGRNREPLRLGRNDLGEIVLPRSGSIAGLVVDASGAPVAGAQVSVVERLPGELRPNALAEQDGTFLLGHLPSLRISVEVHADGHSKLVRNRCRSSSASEPARCASNSGALPS